MVRYYVRWELDEEVEADSKEEAIEKAISQAVSKTGWFENELTAHIKIEAEVTDADKWDFDLVEWE